MSNCDKLANQVSTQMAAVAELRAELFAAQNNPNRAVGISQEADVRARIGVAEGKLLQLELQMNKVCDAENKARARKPKSRGKSSSTAISEVPEEKGFLSQIDMSGFAPKLALGVGAGALLGGIIYFVSK